MVDSVTIEIVFARLLARYGSAWRAKWAGIDPEVVAKDWLRELKHFSAKSIDYALDNLPMDFPPTVGQFREVCLRAPALKLPALPEPKADPQRLGAELRRMRALTAGRRPQAWMAELEQHLRNGGRLTIFQRSCLDNAYANLVNSPSSEVDEIDDADRLRTDGLKAESARLVAEYEAAWQ